MGTSVAVKDWKFQKKFKKFLSLHYEYYKWYYVGHRFSISCWKRKRHFSKTTSIYITTVPFHPGFVSHILVTTWFRFKLKIMLKLFFIEYIVFHLFLSGSFLSLYLDKIYLPFKTLSETKKKNYSLSTLVTLHLLMLVFNKSTSEMS